MKSYVRLQHLGKYIRHTPMVLKLDGKSEHVEHVRRKLMSILIKADVTLHMGTLLVTI